MDAWLQNFLKQREDRHTADRTITISGEHLVVKPSVAPQVGYKLIDVQQQVLRDLEAQKAAEAQNKPAPPGTVTDQEMLAVMEDTIRACLEPDSIPAWDRLRDENHPEPLTFADIYGLTQYILGRAAGVPTDEPSGSSDGSVNAGTSSKAGSRSKAATPKR